MRHTAPGVLRRLLDEPAGVADSDREHVAGCQRCVSGLAALLEDATLSTAAPAAGPARAAAPPPRAGRFEAVLRRPGVVALGVAIALSGAGVAAANGWVQIFRTEQIAPLTLSTADLIALPDLDAYGDLQVTGDGDVVDEVPDAAAAEAQTGLDLPAVRTLPRGVTGEPIYQVGDKVRADFTFSADRAAQAESKAGNTLPPPPPGLDGSAVRLVAGPGLAQIWSSSAGAPALAVGRAVAPSAFSSEVPFATARDYLLSLPSLPEDVAAQLRTFSADGSTLPLPVPADQVATSSAQVNGKPATVLASRDRTFAAVVWVDDGVVTAVAGSLDTDEVLWIARELQ